MRAVVVERCGGPEVLQVKEMDVPEPADNEVLVRLYAAGVNPVDTYRRAGTQGYAPFLPWTPGMDGAGTVELVGRAVRSAKIGERVFVHASAGGTYSGFCLCAEDQLYPLPGALSFQQGACLGVPYFTACRALFTQAHVQGGQNILVHGASGGVGTAALQILSSADVSVFGTAGSEEGMAMIRGFGARSFDHRSERYLSDLSEASGGFHLIVEMRADVNLGSDLELLKPGGTVIVVGSRGRVEITPRDMMGRESRIQGMTLLNATDSERREYVRLITRATEAGSINPVVAQVFPLEDAADAHRAVLGSPHRGNIVLDTSMGQ